ncbi:RHS repeat-associated core domain-containing protein [Streptosporangium sp. NPDC020145]|uniref:RHS repeat domain-containing protein n=1 Tax=Streptosporangium sp. NPDC020145 TaxID=3154694 RepID=UPI00343B8924
MRKRNRKLVGAAVMTTVMTTMLAASLVAGEVGGVASAATTGPPRERAVKVKRFEPPTPGKVPKVKAWRPERPVWPGRESADVVLPAVPDGAAGRSADGGTAVRAGGLPVWLAATAGHGPATVRVENLSDRQGGDALTLRLTRTDKAQSAEDKVRLTVDYRGMASAVGGDWASRLRLWSVSTCVLTPAHTASPAPEHTAASTPTPPGTPVPAGTGTRTPIPAPTGPVPALTPTPSTVPLPRVTSTATPVATPTRMSSGPTPGSLPLQPPDSPAVSPTPDAAPTGTAPGCGPVELPSTVDRDKGTVSAQVNATGLVMLAADSSGPTGDYAATSLTPSSTWNTGGNSGDFTWSYPMRVPPGLGGPEPQLTLSYSSARVDGLMAAANTQPSWVGEGFDWHPGFIERRYGACSKDMENGANNQAETGDLCWVTDNATLSLPGHSGELIRNGDRWHLRDDDGLKVERRTGTTNGDDNGEWWVATDTDGTQYWFGGRAGSQSTLSVPVFGNHAGEACHQSTFAASSCRQAFRWQLDYVVDTHGNTMRVSYAKETNRYSRNSTTTDAADYDRAGYPEKIEYGTRGLDDAPQMRVVLGTADRCLADCGTKDAAHWPDVPFDQECTASPCKPQQISPTFWTTKRLSTVTTQVWNTAGSAWRDVESWTFDHTFPDPDDRGSGTSVTPVLWLNTITHTGRASTETGSAVTLPKVRFTPKLLPNRVDTAGDQYPAMNRYRIGAIKTETGSTIDVTYAGADCVAGTRTPALDNLHDHGLRCYPVKWTPSGHTEPITDFFHKYVVSQVTQAEATGSSPRTITGFTYGGAPAWHYTDEDGLLQDDDKTWSVWRGYGLVTRTTGEGPTRVLEETRYFRGMNGDRLPSGTRSVTMPAAGGAPATADEDAFAGMVREVVSRDVNGVEIGATVYRPWQSDPTASRTIDGSTVHARLVDNGATYTRTTRDGGRAPRTTTSFTEFDAYGMPVWAEDKGDDAVTGDEECSTTEYTRNAGIWLVDRVSRVRSFALDCATAKAKVTAGTVTETDLITDVRTAYDGATAWEGAPAPTKGDVTLVESVKALTGSTWSYVTDRKVTYDAYGRVLTETDARGATVTTAYTPASGAPLTGKTVTGPLGWTTVTVLDPALGLPRTTTDANGRVTALAHDGLGRLTAVWLPGNDRSSNADKPSIGHAYQVSDTGPIVVTSRRLNHAGDYITSYAFYDSLMRQRQTQSADAAGTADHVVVTDTFYDSAGRVLKTHNPYLADAAPGPTLVVPAQDVPSAEYTLFDSAGRTSAQVHLVDEAPASPGGVDERWRTVFGYGGDREDVTPPAGGVVTSSVKDAAGRVVETRQYRTGNVAGSAAGFIRTSYAFDNKGRLAKTTDAEGNEWLYTYDLRGRLVGSTDPDIGTVTKTYDDAGDLVTATNASGQVTAFTYDALGRRTIVRDDSVTGDKRAEWVYDTVAKGQLSKSTRYDGTDQYTKTITGYTVGYQPTQVVYGIPAAQTGLNNTYTYVNTYWPNGLPRTTRLPAVGTLGQEELSHGYDALDLPTTLGTTMGGSYVTGTDHTSFGEVSKIKLRNNAGRTADISRVYESDTRRLETIKTVKESSPAVVSELNLAYDAGGNVTRMSDLAGGDTQCFGVDFLRRLEQAWTQTSTTCAQTVGAGVVGGTNPYWQSYTYDDIGNRTQMVKHGTTSGDAVTTYTVPDGAHRLSASSTTDGVGTSSTAHTYDASGNMKTRSSAAGTQTMTWDREGRLTSVQDGTGTTGYVYDADGGRLVQRDPAGATLYLPGQELRYTTSGGAKTGTRYYSHGGQVVATRSGNTSTTVSWLSGDQHGTAGNVIANTDTQAVAVRRMTPFGEARGLTGTWPTSMNKGFVGGTMDETGLTHLGAREYDPAMGRFISVDPLIDIKDSQQVNGYTYANNNPLSFTDPDGLIHRSCPDGECSDGKGGAHQNRAHNPAHDYNPPYNPGFKGGTCGARPCPTADNADWGPQGARPRGDNMSPLNGGPCGARPCQEYEVAPMGWDRKIDNSEPAPFCVDGLFNCAWEGAWANILPPSNHILKQMGHDLTPDYISVDYTAIVPTGRMGGAGGTAGLTITRYGQVTVNEPRGSLGAPGFGGSARLGWTNGGNDPASVNGFVQGEAASAGIAVPAHRLFGVAVAGVASVADPSQQAVEFGVVGMPPPTKVGVVTAVTFGRYWFTMPGGR